MTPGLRRFCIALGVVVLGTLWLVLDALKNTWQSPVLAGLVTFLPAPLLALLSFDVTQELPGGPKATRFHFGLGLLFGTILGASLGFSVPACLRGTMELDKMLGAVGGFVGAVAGVITTMAKTPPRSSPSE